MARLIPDDVAERDQGPWHASERATLNKLAVMLSDDYTVFHGIHWAPKSLTTQVSRNMNALRQEFSRKHQGRGLSIDHLPYLPESVIEGQLPAGVDPERVIEQAQKEFVPAMSGLGDLGSVTAQTAT